MRGAGSINRDYSKWHFHQGYNVPHQRSQRVAVAARAAGEEVVRSYYRMYNSGNIAGMESIFEPDVVYQDMVYQDEFIGRDEVVEYLGHVSEELGPAGVKFVIDDIADSGDGKVGVMWHLETDQGVLIPFARGCSFYQLSPEGRIKFGRDIPEPSTKTGSANFGILRVLVPIVNRLREKADPSNLPEIPTDAVLWWLFYAGYTYVVLFSTILPGNPVFQTDPAVLQSLLFQSLNFFYLNIGVNALGIHLIPDIPQHPVEEAVFNFVNAWSLMMLPAILSDKKCAKIPAKVQQWFGAFFLTNIFMIPLMAQRAAPEPARQVDASKASMPRTEQPQDSSSTSEPTIKAKSANPSNSMVQSTATGDFPQRQLHPVLRQLRAVGNGPLPRWSPLVGVTCWAIGVLSIAWLCVGRPEAGGWDARAAHIQELAAGDRVYFAFGLDVLLYATFQARLMSGAPTWQRFLPFFGMATWLISGPRQTIDGDK